MARGAIGWQSSPSSCAVNSPPGGGSSCQHTPALAGRSCDTCSVVGCDHEDCSCPLQVCLVPNTPRSGKLVSMRPSALVSCCENSYPSARLTLYPNSVNFAITLSQWSPWISIFTYLTVPPQPHNFLSCCASVVSSASLPITTSITVTALAPRPLRSRITRTNPSLLRVGWVG